MACFTYFLFSPMLLSHQILNYVYWNFHIEYLPDFFAVFRTHSDGCVQIFTWEPSYFLIVVPVINL